MSLIRALAARLPGGRVTSAGDVSRLVFEVDGCWLDARCREAPAVEIFVRTLEIPGFTLRLRAGDTDLPLEVRRRWQTDEYGARFLAFDEAEVAAAVAAARPALRFERHWRVEASDPALGELWLDEPARAALLEATWLRRADGLLGVDARPTAYAYQLERGEVMVRRRDELDVERLDRAVRAGAVLAARPHRIARACLEVARQLGGTTTSDRWDLAGAFAMTIDHGPAAIRIDHVHSLPGEDADDACLRTRARARRLAVEEERWALWHRQVARVHRPDAGRRARRVPAAVLPAGYQGEAADPAAFAGRLAPVAALFDAARPSALWVDDDGLGLWWPGLLAEPARLGPAIELLARLAAPRGGATGPYR
jgi:hypothetical protein